MPESKVVEPRGTSPRGIESAVKVAEMVAKIRPVLAKRLGELHSDGVLKNLPEYAALAGLQQMTSLAKAVSILEQDDTVDPATSTPATALARIGIEGLIYMNYLVDDDVDLRAQGFICSEIMWREAFEDRREGRVWRRAHGRCSAKAPRHPSDTRLPIKDYEGRWCDEYERVFIKRDLSTLRKNPPHVLSGQDGTPDIAQSRAFWNGLALKGRAFAKWEAMNGRWNCHRSWPFGLDAETAYTAGHLDDRLREVAEKEPLQMLDWIERYGLDMFNVLAHFSPTRVAIDPDAFSRIASTTHVLALWAVVRLLAKRFPWAQTLRHSI